MTRSILVVSTGPSSLPVTTVCLDRLGDIASPSGQRALDETAAHALIRFLDIWDAETEDREPEA
jgi:hypothetical protein